MFTAAAETSPAPKFWKWLHCFMSGHPPFLTRVVRVGRGYVSGSTVCRCGRRKVPIYPGCLHQTFQDAYEEYPGEWPKEMFDAQP